MSGVISVLLVDDHPVVRQGLRALLEVQDGMVVAGEAGDGPTAVSLATSLRPDIVLLDLKLPGMDGIAVLESLRSCGLRVLVLTSATEVSVTLSRTRRRVLLEVADNGTGFDPGLASAGLGLTSMRERAAAVGGVLRVSSTPDAGTTVRMEVPA